MTDDNDPRRQESKRHDNQSSNRQVGPFDPTPTNGHYVFGVNKGFEGYVVMSESDVIAVDRLTVNGCYLGTPEDLEIEVPDYEIYEDEHKKVFNFKTESGGQNE